KVGGGSGCRVKQDAGRNGESGKARNVGQLRTSVAAMPSRRWWRDVAGKWFGPPGRIRTDSPSVNGHYCLATKLRITPDGVSCTNMADNNAPARELGFATKSLHAGHTPDSASHARAVPIYQTTSFTFDNSDHAAA